MENLNCFTVMKNTLSSFKFEYSLHDKETAAFHFINGTVVHAKDLSNAKELMENTLHKYNGKYWASETEMNKWEVQFSTAAFSAVYVITNASTGQEASKKALKAITDDLEKLELIKVL